MKELKYIIRDPEGIHARPAGLLVKLATTFASVITIQKEDKTADAKRIFAIMGLGAKQGQEITVTAQGADEDKAIAEIDLFLKENL
ncbi:MAG: HPr family phosphocarrier protein [Lachnospiraceae bacterium]|nr:HPr family phosphocarrier protein [Lachnospiraceae bacterium]